MNLVWRRMVKNLIGRTISSALIIPLLIVSGVMIVGQDLSQKPDNLDCFPSLVDGTGNIFCSKKRAMSNS